MIRVHHHVLSPLSSREWHDLIHTMLACAEPSMLTEFDGEGPDKACMVELFLGRDGDIAALNERCMGCVGPTNILSFPSGFFSSAENWPATEYFEASTRDKNALGNPALGTLFLSVDTLRRECLLYGQEREIHAQRLLAHGLTHLLGYDHGPEMDELCAAMLSSVGEHF